MIFPGTPSMVIVVNDDLTQLSILSGLLEKAGVDVRAFDNAEEALAAMRPEAPPALIVTDLYMPGIDGWRFCRLLRSPEYAFCNEIPILVVSATFAGDQPERIAADIGADVFLPSPVNAKEFVARARSLLEGKVVQYRPRVLIVEDSRTLASLLKKVFTAHGYKADVAGTVHEAEAAFGRTKYSVAVLDYHLPDGLGDRLLDAAAMGSPDCVCLMMTTDPTTALALDWMKRRAAAYLHKPFEPAFLIELCAKARRERALLRAEDLLEARTRELRESEERYRGLFVATPDGLWVHGTDGVILDANETMCSRIGMSRDALLGRNVREFIPIENAEGVDRNVRDILEGRPLIFESTYLSTTGVSVAVEIHERLIPWGGSPAVLGISRDITGRRRAETEKEKLQEQLAQAQKMESVGRLAGGVAHDFNNMLGVILGHAELALDDIGSSVKMCAHLDEIQKAARRSAELTRQLLAFARKQAVTPKVLDLNETVEGMLKMLRRLIGENIDLSWRPGRGIGSVHIDPSQVDQILANLCVNARDAIADTGSISIETGRVSFDDAWCASHAGYYPGDYVMLAVSDNGCGMDAETLGFVFEPFFTTKEMGKGTGLGLATVYGAVRQNNGFVTVYSEPGQGATFNIYLPLHANAATRHPESQPASLLWAGNETILLVEDESIILKMITMMLEKLGYAVIPAATPGDAIHLARERRGSIDLLMTDLVMPEMNGRDLARNLLTLYPDIQVLFMSGYTADVIAHHGVLDPGVHFIQKPFMMKALAQKIAEVLSEKS